MSSPNRRHASISQDRARRRVVIVDAARRAFCHGAYEAVSLRDIAVQADIDVSQIVREFNTKDEVFAAALMSAMERPAAIAGEQWAEVMARELTGASPAILIEPARIVTLSAASPNVSALVRAHAPGLVRGYAGYFRPGPDVDVRAAVAATLVAGLTIMRMLFSPPEPTEELTRELIGPALEALRVGPKHPADGSLSGAAATRAAILAAADTEFSRLGYEHATVRKIAHLAAADPALVIRYFGSKENLFRETLRAHFDMEDTDEPIRTYLDLGLFRILAVSGEVGSGILDITLRSASSDIARQILRDDIGERYIAPLASRLDVPHADTRANLLFGVLIGVGFCRSVVTLEALDKDRGAAVNHLRSLLQCIATHRTAAIT